MKLSKKRKAEIIKLYGHIPTEKEILQKIQESQERMIQALKGAWETKPNDEETTAILLELGEKSAKLKKKIESAFRTKK